MNIQIRQIPDSVRYKGLTTEELRDGYLLSDFFKKDEINYNYIGRIQDAGSYTNQPDAPFRFLPCMVSGLAFYLSQKKNPQMTQTLKLYYEDVEKGNIDIHFDTIIKK